MHSEIWSIIQTFINLLGTSGQFRPLSPVIRIQSKIETVPRDVEFYEQKMCILPSKIEVPRGVRNSKDPYTWQVQEWIVSTLE